MSDSANSTVTDDAKRFDAALARLEAALAASVKKVADMARRTGFEDGVAHAAAQLDDANDAGPDLTPILREELEVVKVREANMHEAVVAARAALNEAMDDIRSALGTI